MCVDIDDLDRKLIGRAQKSIFSQKSIYLFQNMYQNGTVAEFTLTRAGSSALVKFENAKVAVS